LRFPFPLSVNSLSSAVDIAFPLPFPFSSDTSPDSDIGDADRPASEDNFDLLAFLTAPRREEFKPIHDAKWGAYLFDAICRAHTTHTKYRLPSFPTGVLVPVALSLAAVNSLLAAEEGVAAREGAFPLAGATWLVSPVDDPGT